MYSGRWQGSSIKVAYCQFWLFRTGLFENLIVSNKLATISFAPLIIYYFEKD
jgi:hypothetical protein